VNQGADKFALGVPVCILQLRLEVCREFGKTAHHRAHACPPVFIGRLGTDFRIDVGYTSLRSVYPGVLKNAG
jgi:hypothetical protein